MMTDAHLIKAELDRRHREEMERRVNRFLSWRLPDSVCSDLCVTKRGYQNRTGTSLLTADEALQMLEYVLGGDK